MAIKREALAILTMILTGIVALRPSMPDLLLEKEDTGNEVQSNAIPNMMMNEQLRNGACQMEIRYTKQVIGKCAKLGPGVEGCVAGSYIHPFHSDCLFSR
ncbi:Hypothetical protein NTJ_11335 [Nesidiocoris tenuis]|uniref:Kazal-like domain-containing protein n=1 Tax=Nesidiocoris tenuis TaxID=355587 RepID=A0ABN7B5R5_9HEMI|nr:Hypothetical protein NTJ_11335 [Nesidiocoris tenuis]